MIIKIQSPAAANAYVQKPSAGTGISADPFDWATVDTVADTISTVNLFDAGEYGSLELYFNVKLTAEQLYTFSISGADGWGTTAVIYYDGESVATSTFDDMEWVWSLSYTPAVGATGTYLIKITTYSEGYGAGTMSATPVPSDITPWIEKTDGVLVSTGFIGNDMPERYSRLSFASVSLYSLPINGLVLSLPLDGNTVAPTGQTIEYNYITVTYDSELNRVVANYAGYDPCNIRCGNGLHSAITDTSPRTVSIWIKGPIYGYQRFFAGLSLSGAGEIQTDNGILFSSVLTENTWQHLAYTYDGTAMLLYLDGQLVESKAAASVAIESPLYVYGDYPFKGRLSTARIYSRALGAGAIMQLYNEITVTPEA